MGKIFAGFILAACLCGCGGKAEPLSFEYRRDQLATVGIKIFEGAEVVECSSRGPTGAALRILGRAGLDPYGEVLRTGVTPIRFSDGEGYLGAVEVGWEPGDPGVHLKRTDYYIFDKDCRVRVWGSGVEKRA